MFKISGISHSYEALTISNKGLDPSFSSINSSYCIMQFFVNTLRIHVANHVLKNGFGTILTSTWTHLIIHIFYKTHC
jgi:hypothetical protein